LPAVSGDSVVRGSIPLLTIVLGLAPAGVLTERPVDRIPEGGRATVLMPSSMSQTKAYYDCTDASEGYPTPLHKEVWDNVPTTGGRKVTLTTTDRRNLDFEAKTCLGAGAYGLAYKGKVQGVEKVMKVFVRNDEQLDWDRTKTMLSKVPDCTNAGNDFLIKNFDCGTLNFGKKAEIWDVAPGVNLIELAKNLKEKNKQEVKDIAVLVFCKLRMAIKQLQTPDPVTRETTKHGDVDVANIMFDESTQTLTLIDYDLMQRGVGVKDSSVDDATDFGSVAGVIASFFANLCQTMGDSGWEDDVATSTDKCVLEDRVYTMQAEVFAAVAARTDCDAC